MYYRINGAPFSIKDAKEKQEFINVINDDAIFSKHLFCCGVSAEQFTGRVDGVVVHDKDNPKRIYTFKCEGNFPTLKLYQRTSNVVYVIEFPVSKAGQITNEVLQTTKVEEQLVEVVQDHGEIPNVKQTPVVEVIQGHGDEQSEMVQDNSEDTIVITEEKSEEEIEDVQIDKTVGDFSLEESSKKRGRKKKNY